MPGKIYIAVKSAVVSVDGARQTIRKGVHRVREGHALLDKYPHMFEPIDVHFDVEQATAAPGEKRGTKRTKKSD